MPRRSKKSQAARLLWSKQNLSGCTSGEEVELPAPKRRTVEPSPLAYAQSAPTSSIKVEPSQLSYAQCKSDVAVSSRHVNLSQRSYAVQPEAQPDVIRVLASRSQNSVKYSEFSRNRQCACNSLVFLAFLEENSVVTRADLNLVLDKGDRMYCCVRRFVVHTHLASDELPQTVSARRQEYTATRSLSKYGQFTAQPPEGAEDYLNLSDRLQQCFTSDVNSALLIMAGLYIAVFKDKSGRYGFFDPHSRTPNGLPGTQPGTAIMLTFTHLSDMIMGLVESYNLLGIGPNNPYELAPMTFSIEPNDMPTVDNGTHTDNTAVAVASPISVVQINHVTQPEHGMSGPLDVTSITQDAHNKTTLNLTTVPYDLTDSNEEKMLEISSNIMVERPTPEMPKHSMHNSDMSRFFKQQRQKLKRRALRNETSQGTAQKRVKKDIEREKYVNYPAYREKKKSYVTSRYTHHADYRNQIKSNSMGRYSNDNAFRLKKKLVIKHRYANEPVFRMKQKNLIKHKYTNDPVFRCKQMHRIKHRYANDPAFRCKQMHRIKHRYANDPAFRCKQMHRIKHRYANDPAFRCKQMHRIKHRYANDPDFRLRHRQRCALNMYTRYHSEAGFRIAHKMRCAMKIKRKYQRIFFPHPQPLQIANSLRQKAVTAENSLIQKAITAFQEEVKNGPTYVCTVCHKASFPNQVKPCVRSKYQKNPHVAAACLTGSYIHVCDDECGGERQCQVPKERWKEWICSTCHKHLMRGDMPSLAVANKLELTPIPSELCDLNILERHIIAKHIPFAKIISLPKGQQRAIHGAVVCVPSEVEATVNTLPRPEGESQLLRVKLKRRMHYNGHYQFQTLDTKKVLTALSKLKEIHSEYKDISIRDDASSTDQTGDSIAEEPMELADDSAVTAVQDSMVEHHEITEMTLPFASRQRSVDRIEEEPMDIDTWEDTEVICKQQCMVHQQEYTHMTPSDFPEAHIFEYSDPSSGDGIAMDVDTWDYSKVIGRHKCICASSQ